LAKGKAYFTVFIIDEFGERAQVAYNLHDPEQTELPSKGTIECLIEDLRLVTGAYSLTLDYGTINDGQMRSADCVPNATQVYVTLGNYLGPVGLQANQGSFAHRTTWKILDR